MENTTGNSIANDYAIQEQMYEAKEKTKDELRDEIKMLAKQNEIMLTALTDISEATQDSNIFIVSAIRTTANETIKKIIA